MDYVNTVSKVVLLIFVVLLIYGVGLEWKGTTDVTERSKKIVEESSDPALSVCDIAQNVIEINNFAESELVIQWRRGAIVAFALLILIPAFTQIKFSVTQQLVVLLISFFAYTSVSGYNDYHMRTVYSTAVNDSLINAVNKSPSGTCTPGIIQL
jgi:hypothetical protein